MGPSEIRDLSAFGRTRVFLALQPLSLFAPARLSDFAALPVLRRHYLPGTPTSAIVLDRLVTLFFLLLMMPIAVSQVWAARASGALIAGIIAALLGVVALPFILSNQLVRRVANRYLLPLWPGLLEGFGRHTELLLYSSRSRLVANLLVTASKTLVSAAVIVLLTRNFGVSLGLGTAVWMSILVQLATSLPISVQGLGVAEASLVLLFSVNGLPEAVALAVVLTSRIVLLFVMALLYLMATLPLLGESLPGA